MSLCGSIYISQHDTCNKHRIMLCVIYIAAPIALNFVAEILVYPDHAGLDGTAPAVCRSLDLTFSVL